VRELKNVVERAVAHWPEEAEAIDRVTFDPFESPFRPSRQATATPRADVATAPVISVSASPLPDDFKSAVAAFESGLLARALADARHNQRVAARRLGLGYHQFRNTLRKHGLLPARDKGPD
jgi:psp operon transcriptional activator